MGILSRLHTGRFKTQWSLEQAALIERLRQMPLTCAQDVIAEAIWEQARDAFLSTWGVTLSREYPCIHWLKGERCPGSLACYEHGAIPGADHTDGLIKDGKPWAIVTQPYGLGDDLPKLVDYCQRHDLVLQVEPWSWHYPGRTLLLLVRPRGDTVARERLVPVREVAAIPA